MTVKNLARRRVLRIVGKVLQPILSRTTVSGRANIPKSGPLIVVGNHSAYVETILMLMVMPWPIELMGATDVPLRGRFTFLNQLWGVLPINRGEIDRTGLKAAADLLDAGDTLGIFPEGGIWDRKIGDARLGVAYLSQQTGAPILPIGFGGVIGATEKIVRFQRPRFTVNIGKLIPAVPSPANYRERKAIAKTASDTIMNAIYQLVPADDEINKLGDRTEAYSFDVQLTNASGAVVPIPSELAIPYGDDLALFFYRPVLLSVVIDNLERPAAAALTRLDTERDPAAFAVALREMLQVFVTEKPGFLGYRLGYKRAANVVDGLQHLLKLAEWAEPQKLHMHIVPKATFTYDDGRVEQFATPPQRHMT